MEIQNEKFQFYQYGIPLMKKEFLSIIQHICCGAYQDNFVINSNKKTISYS